MNNFGLSIVMYESLAKNNPPFLLDDSLGQKATAYSHTLTDRIGFDTASFTLPINYILANEWMETGIARHIEVYNPSGLLIFEGAVNIVEITMGGHTISVGPWLEISNDVTILYRTNSYNTNPPVGGDAASGGPYTDAASQGQYLILEKMISGGEGDSTEMTTLAQTFLRERKFPQVSRRFSSSSSSEQITARIEVKGYGHLLERYYVSDSTSGTDDLSVKIETVLTADPNSLLGTATAKNLFATNTTAVGQYEDDERTAKAIIDELIQVGDGSNTQYIFGIYENREAQYGAISYTEHAYEQSSADPAGVIYGLHGDEVMPYDVRPGQWILDTGFSAGVLSTGDLFTNPSASFIKQVRFSAPWNLELEGGRVSTPHQVIAAKFALAQVM